MAKNSLKLLWWSMLVGGIYDAVFALPILFFPDACGKILGIRCPGVPFDYYVRFAALFLLIIACGYFFSLRSLERNRSMVNMMIISRSLGFIFMAGYATLPPPGIRMESAWLYMGLGDLIFALWHIWGKSRAGAELLS